MDDFEQTLPNGSPIASDAARLARYAVTALGGYMVGKGYIQGDTVEAVATVAATAVPVIIGMIIARCNKSAGVAVRRGAANVFGFRSSPPPADPIKDNVMFIYSQSTGKFSRASGEVLGTGYSGHGEGKNNPAMQDVVAVGPIPRGYWRLGTSYHSVRTGPVTIPLLKLDDKPSDDQDQETGRSAFRIHGDSAKAPGEASRGCIILPRPLRETIAHAPDEILWVTE